jgi:hypothetical protein
MEKRFDMASQHGWKRTTGLKAQSTAPELKLLTMAKWQHQLTVFNTHKIKKKCRHAFSIIHADQIVPPARSVIIGQ